MSRREQTGARPRRRFAEPRTRSRSPRQSPYDVLQVSPDASAEVIQAAYRVLARAYHPDLNTSPEAERKMQQLNAAYAALLHPAGPPRPAGVLSERSHTPAARWSQGERASAPPAASSFRYRSAGRLIAILAALVMLLGLALLLTVGLSLVLDALDQPVFAGNA